MSPYIESGYIVVLGTLASYSAILVMRERRAAARLSASGADMGPKRAGRPKEAGQRDRSAAPAAAAAGDEATEADG